MIQSRAKRKQASEREPEQPKKRRPLADIGANRQPAKQAATQNTSKANAANSRGLGGTSTKHTASFVGDAKAQIRRAANDLRTEIKASKNQGSPSTKRRLPPTISPPALGENLVYTQAQSMIKGFRDTVDKYRQVNSQPLMKPQTEETRWQQDSKDLNALNKIVKHGLVEVINAYVVPDASRRPTFPSECTERSDLAGIANDLVREIQPVDMEHTWGACAYDMLKGLAGILKPLPEQPE